MMGAVQLDMFPALPPVTLSIRWHDLFGGKAQTIDEAERRARWATWLKLARSEGQRDAAEWWNNSGECRDCKHVRGGWCSLMGLPTTINPILTMRHGVLGMACMGGGYEAKGLPAAPVEGVKGS